MISQGLTLTLLGMAIVFVFLILLVLLMNVVSALILRFFPEKEKPREKKGPKEMELAAAVAAAKSYRNN